jgi:hypothetical protein
MTLPGRFASDGGRFDDIWGQAAVSQAVGEADRTERALLAAMIVAGASVLAFSPSLRRFMWRAAREALTTWLPLYIARQVSAAWRASATRDGPGEAR